jgi:hypothetical protein
MPEKTTAAAIVCYFDTPAQLYSACEALRDAGYQHFDAHTPFPVHGLERAMGLRPTRLPWAILACGATGMASAILMQWWMSSVDYPLNISGKPAASFQAWVPIIFELTVLLSAFGCFFGLWIANRLPKFYDAVMKHPSFHRATDDRFFVSVESREPQYDSKKTRELLEQLGAKEIAEVEP